MAANDSDEWARDSAGYVYLVPVGRCAAGATDHGDIALSLGGISPQAPGGQEHCGQYLCSTSEAMNIAKMLVRAVALADAEASAPKVIPELAK